MPWSTEPWPDPASIKPPKPRKEKPPKIPKKMGRPSYIEEKKMMDEIMVNLTVLGMPESRAFEAAGASHALAQLWRSRALKAMKRWSRLTPKEQEQEKPYVDFLEMIRTALIKFEQYHLSNWANVARTNWQASKTLLATVFPERYASRHIVRGDPQAPVQHEVAHRVMTPEEMEIRRAQILAKSRQLVSVVDADQMAKQSAEEALVEILDEDEDTEDGDPGE